jgi:non-heme chloroperoxidase
MLPPERNLEVRSHLPARTDRKPPLLFVHGGYCDAWCWDPYFLPWFAAHGYARTRSLRGHGTSGGRALFVADSMITRLSSALPEPRLPPVLIGHDGRPDREHPLGTRPYAQRLCAGSSGSLGRLPGACALHPNIWSLQRLDAPHLAGDVLAALRPLYFSNDVAPEVVAEAMFHIGAESPRAILDLTLRWHDRRPETKITPFVLGAEGDRIAIPADARATAELYETEAIIVPGLAHMMMLERGWQAVAEPLLEWLERETFARGTGTRAGK